MTEAIQHSTAIKMRRSRKRHTNRSDKNVRQNLGELQRDPKSFVPSEDARSLPLETEPSVSHVGTLI